MPARDGKGPIGQGPKTGRGMGKCKSPGESVAQSQISEGNQPNGWGGRLWNATAGRLFGRRRVYRANR
jgi:hypothetical protein